MATANPIMRKAEFKADDQGLCQVNPKTLNSQNQILRLPCPSCLSLSTASVVACGSLLGSGFNGRTVFPLPPARGPLFPPPCCTCDGPGPCAFASNWPKISIGIIGGLSGSIPFWLVTTESDVAEARGVKEFDDPGTGGGPRGLGSRGGVDSAPAGAPCWKPNG
jgi:hypothetical protein